MKILALAIAALCALALPAQAILWTGTMSWTLTSLTGSPPASGGQVGDTFTGSYSYESPTENFDSTTFEGQGTFSHYQGTINVPTWMTPGGVIGFFQSDATLQVQDGVVTFSWGCDFGPHSSNWFSGQMNFGVVGAGTDGADLGGTGVYTFNEPTAPPVGVPDAASTALLLSVALAGLALYRRRCRTAWASGGK